MNLKSLAFSSFFVLFSFVNTVNSFYYNDTSFIESISDVHFKGYFYPYFNQTVNYLNYLSKNNEINRKCRDSLSRLILGINNNEPWSLKFLESTGKQIDGKF